MLILIFIFTLLFPPTPITDPLLLRFPLSLLLLPLLVLLLLLSFVDAELELDNTMDKSILLLSTICRMGSNNSFNTGSATDLIYPILAPPPPPPCDVDGMDGVDGGDATMVMTSGA